MTIKTQFWKRGPIWQWAVKAGPDTIGRGLECERDLAHAAAKLAKTKWLLKRMKELTYGH